MSTKVSQKDYLKKYLSSDVEQPKKKKKKKEKTVTPSVKIIDDDIDLSKLARLSDDELDKFNMGEDAPQIVGVVDDRPPELVAKEDYTKNRKWKTLEAVDDQTISGANKSGNLSPIHSKKQRNSDVSPPRRSKRSPDTSPPRRTRRSSDASPPRRSRRSPDASPPRRSKRSPNRSPPRRSRRSPDHSPPRRSRRSPDASPPRRSKRSSDHSPPRRSKRSSDRSPPRRSRRSSDASPPRRSKRSSERSPPRHSRQSSGASPPRRPKASCDKLSRFNRRSRSLSSSRHSNRRSHNTPPRRLGRSPDISPPRKSNQGAENSPRRRQKSIDASPPRQAKKSTSPVAKALPKRSSDSPPPTHKKMMKTLEGKVAGLQDAKALRDENEKYRQREEEMFRKMAKEYKPDSEAVVRDRKTGRQRNVQVDAEKEKERLRKEEERKAVYDRWGKGLKQIEDYKERHAEEQYEQSKPLARYSDDKDLDEHLKQQSRDGDPMAEYFRKKNKDSQSGPSKPIYQGSFPDNRFNIRPGYRWDGLDRSNGYEKKWFETQSKKKAIEEEAYKYSVEDM